MYFTLTLVVACAAVFVLFSQEFLELLKKILAIKGAKIILPLALGSFLVVQYEYWCLWLTYHYGVFLHTSIQFLASWLPFSNAVTVVQIVFLTLISTLPVYLLNIWHKKRTYRDYPYLYLTSTLLWISTALIVFAAV